MAAKPLDEQSPWPRVRSTNGSTLTLHLPQVERWTGNSFTARAAVEVKLANIKSEILGVIWLDAHGTVDRATRMVTLDRIEITKSRFPDAGANSTNALAVVRQVIPSGDVTVSLDYLITSLGFDRAAARQGPRGLKNAPPTIIWATNRTVLVIVDGEPVMRPVTNSPLERVINTPALLLRDKDGGKFYLSGDGQCFTAPALNGPWALAQTPPPEVAALLPHSTNAPAQEGPPPKIVVSTKPAELLMTSGFPEFRPIRGTALQYAADSDNQLFFYTTDREAYLLLSGRWFKAKSLNGPWTYVAPRDLPSDFARIPPGTPQGVVLASVPNTPQSELALLANSVPTTATVNRHEASLQLSYDGDPNFKPIEGTSMSYAINAQLPVIHSAGSYYAVQDGVWFVASAPTGPWKVAAEVPEEIYTIPPSSPVYYATYARIFDANDDEVDVGYTPGYQGAYEEDGTLVYGTGYDYEPYYGEDYYGWGWTWGYGYVYVPWWQWWCWRPWWGPPSGLRAALIENIYDRWQGGNQIIHHDRRSGQGANVKRPAAFSGYPALYGRFKGSSRPAALQPPPNTLALNPYTRPSSQVRSGEVPRGAQLLSTVRQSPGAGRDLYASPDGSVYRRKNDGWYRHEANGNWKFFAPTQGQIQNERATVARGGQTGGEGAVYRPAAISDGDRGERAAALRNRVPDSGSEVRAQQVADLEREYYARSIAQMRAQNNHPVRMGGGRRREIHQENAICLTTLTNPQNESSNRTREFPRCSLV